MALSRIAVPLVLTALPASFELDPAVLAALPLNIRAEALSHYALPRPFQLPSPDINEVAQQRDHITLPLPISWGIMTSCPPVSYSDIARPAPPACPYPIFYPRLASSTCPPVP